MRTSPLLAITCIVMVILGAAFCLPSQPPYTGFPAWDKTALAAQGPQAPTAPAAAAPEPQPPKPLLGHLLTPPAAWLTAYASESIERSYTIFSIRALIERIGQHEQQIAALTARVVALEKQLADASKERIDTAVEKK